MSVRQDLFAFTIGQLRYGQTQEELSEELNRCVKAAQTHGKTAKLTLELTVKPQGAGLTRGQLVYGRPEKARTY